MGFAPFLAHILLAFNILQEDNNKLKFQDMLKKHLVFVLLMVMAIASANAGTWKLHNYYVTGKIQNIFDIGDKVYYLNSNSLYQFDKATQTTTALGVHNMLSDNTKIKQIMNDSHA